MPALYSADGLGVRTVKIKLTVLFLRLIGRLPLALLDYLGDGIGLLMWLLNTRERQVTEINLAHCLPALTPPQRAQLTRSSLRDFGRNALEMLHVWFSSPQHTLDGTGEVEGEAVMTAALAHGRGVIVLSPHFGNWEWLGIYLGRHYQITNMYLPAKKNPEMGELVIQARSRDGANVVPADAGGVRAVLKILKAGRVVGILPDQEPKQAGAEFAPFFGQPALTMTLVSNLLQRTGARAVFAAAIRQPHEHRFKLVFREPDSAIYDPDLQVSLAALNRGVEQLVAEAPEQYQWVYKRFKRQPPGLTDPYAVLKQARDE